MSLYETLTGADPAAGAPADLTTPNHYVEVQSIACTLVTSAVVASRLVNLGISAVVDTPPFYARMILSSSQAASLTETYTWQAGYPAETRADGTGGTNTSLGFPGGLILPPLTVIRCNALLLDVGDNFSPIVALVRRVYPTPRGGFAYDVR